MRLKRKYEHLDTEINTKLNVLKNIQERRCFRQTTTAKEMKLLSLQWPSIREKGKQRVVRLAYLHTSEMLADRLAKPLLDIIETDPRRQELQEE